MRGNVKTFNKWWKSLVIHFCNINNNKIETVFLQKEMRSQ